jgi:hypothetical protein
VAVVALDRGRSILRDLRDVLGADARLVDVVIDEWVEIKNEVPTEPANVAAEILRTHRGELSIPDGMTFDAILLADAYHRLWKPEKLLTALSARLSATGFVAVIDREGPDDEPRRIAGHRRRIGPAVARPLRFHRAPCGP